MPQIDFNIFFNLTFYIIILFFILVDLIILKYIESYGFFKLALDKYKGSLVKLLFQDFSFSKFYFLNLLNKIQNIANFKNYFVSIFFKLDKSLSLLSFEKKNFRFFNYSLAKCKFNVNLNKFFLSSSLFTSIMESRSFNYKVHLPENAQMGFSRPVSYIAKGIVEFHHDVLFFLIVIVGFVFWFLYRSFFFFSEKNNPNLGKKPLNYVRHNTLLEIVWTLIPGLILLIIILPSFALLFAMEDSLPYKLTLKCIGHQWYWEYETDFFMDKDLSLFQFFSIFQKGGNFFPEMLSSVFIKEIVFNEYSKLIDLGVSEFNLLDFNKIENYVYNLNTNRVSIDLLDMVLNKDKIACKNEVFSFVLKNKLFELWSISHEIDYSYFFLKSEGSNLVSNMDPLENSALRLYGVDKIVFLPVKCNIRLLITSVDVLHSWTLPALGVKVDACPGRLNQAFLNSKVEGIFFGQCSEICGTNHAFMPIVVCFLNELDYLSYKTRLLSNFNLYYRFLVFILSYNLL